MNNEIPHHPSTDTTGREQNSAETLTPEPTGACVGTDAPLLSAAFCSASSTGETLKERYEKWGKSWYVKAVGIVFYVSILGFCIGCLGFAAHIDWMMILGWLVAGASGLAAMMTLMVTEPDLSNY